MSGGFDPYHRWLGISPASQPPNHYRLLGLELFESDPEVIRDAAERQMAHVRMYHLGKYAETAQKILNELASAKASLLDPFEKSFYDYEVEKKQSILNDRQPPIGEGPPRLPSDGTADDAVAAAGSSDSVRRWRIGLNGRTFVLAVIVIMDFAFPAMLYLHWTAMSEKESVAARLAGTESELLAAQRNLEEEQASWAQAQEELSAANAKSNQLLQNTKTELNAALEKIKTLEKADKLFNDNKKKPSQQTVEDDKSKEVSIADDSENQTALSNLPPSADADFRNFTFQRIAEFNNANPPRLKSLMITGPRATAGAGMILIYRGDNGLLGKLQILEYEPDGSSVTVRWATYKHDGSILTEGNRLKIKKTSSYRPDYRLEDGNLGTSVGLVLLQMSSPFTPSILVFPSGRYCVYSTYHTQGRRIPDKVENDHGVAIDAPAGRRVRVLKDHNSSIVSVSFSGDGKLIITCSSDGRAVLWNVDGGEKLRSLNGAGRPVSCVAFSPDSRRVVVGGGATGVVSWSTTGGERIDRFFGQIHKSTVHEFSSDGNLVIGWNSGGVIAWDVENGERLGSFYDFSGRRAISSVAVNGGEQPCILLGSEGGGVSLIDITTRITKILRGLSGGGPVKSVAIGPDRAVLAGFTNGMVIFWDAEKNIPVTLREIGKSVNRVAFSPDGQNILCESEEEAIVWLNAEDRKPQSFTKTLGVKTVFSPDGNALLVCIDHGQAVLYDVETAKPLRKFSGHAGQITDMAFNPNGLEIVTGSVDRTAVLWEVDAK